jgi:hypothetical protein
LSRAKAAAEHVVAKIVDSGRDIHGKIVGGRKPLALPSVGEGVRAAPEDGGARRAAFLREDRPQPRHVRDLPAKLKHPEKFLP